MPSHFGRFLRIPRPCAPAAASRSALGSASAPAPAPAPAPAAARRLLSAAPSPRMTGGEQQIYTKLSRELRPTKLTVSDASGGCGSMYVVEIEAECFRGLTRVKQTKMVNNLLKEEIKDMHGMRVLCSVPPEQ
ncbi:hypothetical protein LPJ79_002529 [Coemansia sp. RSA 1821]|nr:bola protein [Coemansia mojavensis]KAJ1750944.1 hypothetical protein LPJ79_002529 [Coemansia sp. RSA 1821]KAJ2676576.1 hypothetical protein IWW42_000451 [Coemansia sp. RSA 1085]